VPIDRLATYQLTRESVFIRIALPFILSQNTPATTLIDGDQRVRNDIRAVLLRKGVLHVNLHYGGNAHHVIECIFKAFARAVDAATRIDPRLAGAVPSTKGTLTT